MIGSKIPNTWDTSISPTARGQRLCQVMLLLNARFQSPGFQCILAASRAQQSTRRETDGELGFGPQIGVFIQLMHTRLVTVVQLWKRNWGDWKYGLGRSRRSRRILLTFIRVSHKPLFMIQLHLISGSPKVKDIPGDTKVVGWWGLGKNYAQQQITLHCHS